MRKCLRQGCPQERAHGTTGKDGDNLPPVQPGQNSPGQRPAGRCGRSSRGGGHLGALLPRMTPVNGRTGSRVRQRSDVGRSDVGRCWRPGPSGRAERSGPRRRLRQGCPPFGPELLGGRGDGVTGRAAPAVSVFRVRTTPDCAVELPETRLIIRNNRLITFVRCRFRHSLVIAWAPSQYHYAVLCSATLRVYGVIRTPVVKGQHLTAMPVRVWCPDFGMRSGGGPGRFFGGRNTRTTLEPGCCDAWSDRHARPESSAWWRSPLQ